jgi:hypothetical protein
MSNDIRLFGTLAGISLAIGSYIILVISNTLVTLFVGFSCIFLGLIFAGYTIVLHLKNRMHKNTPIQDAIIASHEFELNLQHHGAPTNNTIRSESSDNLTTAKTSFITEFEKLVHEHALGVIDTHTYNSRKKDLLNHPNMPNRTNTTNATVSASRTHEQDYTHDDALIDYLEGLITTEEYERRTNDSVKKYDS